MQEITLSELKELLNKKKAFPVFKKKLRKKDLEQVFSRKELRGVSAIKSFTLGFGVIVCVQGIFAVSLIGIVVGLVWVVISLFMKNPSEKFLLDRIKKDGDTLIEAYEANLVKFYLYGSQGLISPDKTKITQD